METGKLDDEELLRLALYAINRGADADSLVLLRALLERDPENVHAHYLIAAQHAQLGMFDRAEQGFRTVVARAPHLPIARFQLAQLLALKGERDEARTLLAPLSALQDSLAAYARALEAVIAEDPAAAAAELEMGLELPQDNPALETDMRRMLASLVANDVGVVAQAGIAMPAPMLLSNYQRGST